MMKKLTYKKLYSLILVVTLLTIIGVIFTCSSYYQLQKHAVYTAENQLSTINHSAINIVKTKFHSYRQTVNLIQPHMPKKQLVDEPKNLSDLKKEKALVGLFLFSQDGTLINSQPLHTAQPTTGLAKLVAKDPDFSQALSGGIKQNGAVYFNDNHSYINIYQTISLENNQHALLVLLADLQTLYQSELLDTDDQAGYTMVKNQEMKVVMHPSSEQVGLSIVNGREEKYPTLDLSDLKKLEKKQLTQSRGNAIYYSYWWPKPKIKKVLKITSFEWTTIGNNRLIFASNEDYYERNGLLLQDGLIIIGLLMILLVVIVSLGLSVKYYHKRNQTYAENLRLKEHQQLLQEKHDLEKQILQESKLETIGLLTTTIVHDMNNFLTPIIGNLQLMMEEHHEDELLVDDLNEVYESAIKGQNLSKNVLRFSKVETAPRSNYAISQVIQEAIDHLSLLMPKSFTLTTTLPDIGETVFEKEDLQIIIYNLITNAYQAKQDAHVSVRVFLTDEPSAYFDHSLLAIEKTKNHDQIAIIGISDNGPGIPLEIREKIFTPFFTTKKEVGGTGLGLFIVSSIIQKNGWLIQLVSQPQGTTFYLGIPLSKFQKIDSH